MENNPSIIEESRIDLTLPQLVKELFTNYKDFLKTHLIVEKPPSLFIIIWLLGMSSVVYRIEMKYLSAQTYQLENWFLIWALILIGGVIAGYLGYWIGGTLYHMRVWVSGGSKDFRISRHLFLYTGLPVYLATIFITIVDTVVYGNRYFAERTNLLLDLSLFSLCVMGIIFAISLSYRGVCLLQKTKPIRSIIFFIVLPAIFYSPLFGGFVYKFCGQNAKGMDYNKQALELMFTGQYEKAEKVFNRALKITTKDEKENIIKIYVNLAQLYEHKGENGQAKECYRKALSFADPESSGYHSVLGKMSILNGDTYEGIGDFERSLELNPNDFYAHYHLGLIFLGQVDSEIKDYERALVHNEKAFHLDKGPFPTQNLAINYYLLNRYSDALHLFESLNTLSPKNALVKYCMGRIYYSNNELNKAKLFLQEALTLDSSLPSADIEHILK